MNFTKIALGIITLAILGVFIANQLDSTSTHESKVIGQNSAGVSSSTQSEIAGTDANTQGTAQQSPSNNPANNQASKLGRPISPEERNKRVQTKDMVMGASKQAVSGSQVTFHILVKLKDGTVAIDSRKEAGPWKGVLGNGSMMNGLNEGIHGMFQGGKRAIWIPAHLAYGTGGIPGQIPPNADLYAEVEMVSVF
jgi:peptidylprolyl isomerase